MERILDFLLGPWNTTNFSIEMYTASGDEAAANDSIQRLKDAQSHQPAIFDA
jgi:hypothetical protein